MTLKDYEQIWKETNAEVARNRSYGDADWCRVYNRKIEIAMFRKQNRGRILAKPSRQ